MLYNDLRSWMSKVDEFGELKTVEGSTGNTRWVR